PPAWPGAAGGADSGTVADRRAVVAGLAAGLAFSLTAPDERVTVRVSPLRVSLARGDQDPTELPARCGARSASIAKSWYYWAATGRSWPARSVTWTGSRWRRRS